MVIKVEVNGVTAVTGSRMVSKHNLRNVNRSCVFDLKTESARKTWRNK
jgi:hypothetical protein